VMAIISLAGLGYKRKSFHDFHSGVLGKLIF
jgi:hypothetical protein